MRSQEYSAKHIEFCSNEIRKLVSMITASTDRVDYLEKGVARPEAPIVSKPLCLSGDISMAESRILGRVMSGVDEEWKKRMAEEDKHTIRKYESLNSCVHTMDLDLSSLNEREGEVRPVLPQLRLVAGDVEAGRCPQEVGIKKYASAFDADETRVERLGRLG